MFERAQENLAKSDARKKLKEKTILQIRTALSNPKDIIRDHFQVVEDESERMDMLNNEQQSKIKKKENSITFEEFEEKHKYF